MAKIQLTAQKGSTLYDLAKIFGTTVDELKKSNNLDSNVIQPGQVLSYNTDDVEGVQKRFKDLQNYRKEKYEKDKNAYDTYQAKAKSSAESFKKRETEDYGDLSQGHIKDYTLNRKEKGWKSVDDYKKYLEQEHKSNQQTVDAAKK